MNSLSPVSATAVYNGLSQPVVRHDPKDLLDSGLLHGAKFLDGQNLCEVVDTAINSMAYPLSDSGRPIPEDIEYEFWNFCQKVHQKKPFFIRHSSSITEQTPGGAGYRFYTLEAPLNSDKALLAYHLESKSYFTAKASDGYVSVAPESKKNSLADILEVLAPPAIYVGIKLHDKALMNAFIASLAIESQPVKCQFREKHFVPLTVLFTDKENVKELMAKVVADLPRDLKICYCPDNGSLSFGYGLFTIKALASRSDALYMLTGTDSKTLFEGYTRIGIPVKFKSLMLRNPFEPEYLLSFTYPGKPKEIPFSSADVEVLIRQWLELYPGITIGESHMDISSKEFLCRHLRTMVECGVTTFYMEHLMMEEFQDELDEYVSEPSAELPTALGAYLDRLSRGNVIHAGQCGFKDVIIAAKEAGIKRIVCIDSFYSYLATAGDGYLKGNTSTRHRCRDLHSQAAKVFSSTQDGGKFLFFVGGAHLNDYKEVPGIGTLTGSLNLYIIDSTKDSLEPNGIYNLEKKSYTFDLLMHVNKPPKK